MKQIAAILIPIFILFSCSEHDPYSDLNLNESDFKYKIAVEGFISTEKEPCIIKLTKPAIINNQVSFETIKDATVLLKNRKQTYSYYLDSNDFIDSKFYFYRSMDSICGVAGETYELIIQYNNKTYFAIEQMPPPPNDQFNIPLILEGSSEISISTQKHNFGYDNTNIWAYYIEYYDSYLLEETAISYNQYFRNTGICYTHEGSIPQGSFSPSSSASGTGGYLTDTLVVLKAEISENYRNHLSDMFNETDWQGSIFSTIPGNVSTNLSEGAVGFFYAINIKQKKYSIRDFSTN